MKKKPVVSPARLKAIDRLGALKEKIDALQKVHDSLETKLRGRLGVFETDNYKLSVFDAVGKKFNWVRAKKLLGAKYDKLWIENPYRSSKLTKIVG